LPVTRVYGGIWVNQKCLASQVAYYRVFLGFYSLGARILQRV